MSSLTDVDKRYLENILGMQTGFVLDYTDSSFGAFFKRHNIAIHSPKYQTIGTSKAKKMRSFWEQENDTLVGQILDEMLESYEASCVLNGTKPDTQVLDKSKQIVSRLKGVYQKENADTKTSFLDKEFEIPNLSKLPIERSLVAIIEMRLDEARTALKAGAHLSVIFLCGSVLEAVLLGKANNEPALYNSCPASPKTQEDKVKRFNEWSLASLIDVSCAVGVIEPDIKKFGHGLRDFRNYIHPYQQMMSGFFPDEHTAKVCFQVLKAALASVAGDRG
ncbi:hypothetical protein GO013_04945 [Pseudodesulfovibrio sp. JC047]|uniref:hypothetical protein n=1 Tax=Pseudodesulfovibrio sp. JC047 TaxID=2683199 RepID=UPI0013D6F70A|nr:hypothetical protein [Pseudodesulfovibrio sp. JC047]NDV18765.1 hypothetical protein [Pseudodesulfovibrio sp. JC047]